MWCAHSKPVLAGADALGALAIATRPPNATELVTANAAFGANNSKSAPISSPRRGVGLSKSAPISSPRRSVGLRAIARRYARNGNFATWSRKVHKCSGFAGKNQAHGSHLHRSRRDPLPPPAGDRRWSRNDGGQLGARAARGPRRYSHSRRNPARPW